MMTISKDIRFYDTSSLLSFGVSILWEEKSFVISSVTIKELTDIINYSSNNKNMDTDEYSNAKSLLIFLNRYPEKCQIITHREQNELIIKPKVSFINNSIKILSDALYYDRYIRPDEVIFVTHDLELGNIANMFLGDQMIEII